MAISAQDLERACEWLGGVWRGSGEGLRAQSQDWVDVRMREMVWLRFGYDVKREDRG